MVYNTTLTYPQCHCDHIGGLGKYHIPAPGFTKRHCRSPVVSPLRLGRGEPPSVHFTTPLIGTIVWQISKPMGDVVCSLVVTTFGLVRWWAGQTSNIAPSTPLSLQFTAYLTIIQLRDIHIVPGSSLSRLRSPSGYSAGTTNQWAQYATR